MDSAVPATRALQAKYAWTAWWYDILDYPWERQYRLWRPALVGDLDGNVLEAGVGTGRNLEYYRPSVNLTAIDLSAAMLRKARRRSRRARCSVSLIQEDATRMESIPAARFDWVVSTFMCCVMPDELQPLAIRQFERILKPGGKFRLLEMVYSGDQKLRRRQERFAPFVEKVYGARFDRHTLQHLRQAPGLEITRTYFLKKDVYLVVEGERLWGERQVVPFSRGSSRDPLAFHAPESQSHLGGARQLVPPSQATRPRENRLAFSFSRYPNPDAAASAASKAAS